MSGIPEPRVGWDYHRNCGACHASLADVDWSNGRLHCKACGKLVAVVDGKPLDPSAGVKEVLDEVAAELIRARQKFPAFNSAHEGYAVLAEEVDELWEEIKKNQSKRSLDKMRTEAIQCAAMCVRFVLDIPDRKRNV